jgi:hypothetical protein
MRFKPLVSSDDLLKAEAEIAVEAENARTSSVAVAVHPPQRPEAEGAHLRPDPRFEPLVASATVRLLAFFGMKARLRRIETVNRIGRTVALGCASGLYDPERKAGGREYAMAMRLRAMAADPATPIDELPVILGWVQALVSMGCKGMTPERARSA